MVDNKINSQLQLALRFERLLTNEFKSLFVESEQRGIWELVMQYTGDLDELTKEYNFRAYDLKGGFAQIFISKIQILNLSNSAQVVFLSLPTRCEYIDIGLGRVCASNVSNPNSTFYVTGAGILLAVIDSGIDYSHPDFIDGSGKSRIAYLWDQTLQGTPPQGFSGGVEFTNEQLNEALGKNTKAEQLLVVPSQDPIGHGTALAGIAAGNGNGSAGKSNRGMATECELIAVKLGTKDNAHPRDIEIMQGINYAIERAIQLRRPLVILVGSGNNTTGHNGTAPLEIYMTEVSSSWICNMVVGTGNQGNRGSHASGSIQENQSQSVQLLIEGEITNYACCIWKSFIDEISLVVEAPNGETTDVLSLLTTNRAYLFDETAVLVNFSEPVTNAGKQEIYILLQGQNGSVINRGIWTLTLRGDSVLEGGFNVWGTIVTQSDNLTRFLNADLNLTLTSPATAQGITSVAAFNGSTGQLASFSGRGFTNDLRVKPDLAAPGVNITVPSSKEGEIYTTLSGTSTASAFVAGAYVLMMAYGILQLGNVNLYGEVLKIYLLREARRPSNYAPYPNNSWGYGTLCLEASLANMKQIADSSN